MEWGTLVATLGGGLIAVAGTVLADRLRTRQEHRRGLQARRQDVSTPSSSRRRARPTPNRAVSRSTAPRPPTWTKQAASR